MIVALLGSDLYSKNLEIEKFLAEALGERAQDPLAKKILYATDVNLRSVAGEVIDACDSVSLFAPEQAVVVRRAEALKAAEAKALAAWLKGKPECSLLFEFEKLLASSELYKALKAAGAKLEKYDVPKSWEMERWIVALCGSKWGKKIEPGASRYLADAIGTDTARVASELEKVSLHSPDAPSFTEALVKEIVVPQREVLPYEIKESFGNKDARAFTKKLHELMALQNVEGVQIVSVLFHYAVQLLHTCAMLEEGKAPKEIAKKLGVNEYIFCTKGNEPRRARTWGAPLLCRIVKRLGELDLAFKNGTYQAKVTQELMLASLVPLR